MVTDLDFVGPRRRLLRDGSRTLARKTHLVGSRPSLSASDGLVATSVRRCNIWVFCAPDLPCLEHSDRAVASGGLRHYY